MPDLNDLIMGMSDHTTDPSHPFYGQAHTDQGERGKTIVTGIRFRDLADCAVRAIAYSVPLEDMPDRFKRSTAIEDGTLNYNDLYDMDLSSIDPLCIVSCLCCEVEKMMGIYPNIAAPSDGGGM